MKKLLSILLFTYLNVQAQTLQVPGRGSASGDTLAALKTRPQVILDMNFTDPRADIVALSVFNRYVNDGYFIPLCITSSHTNNGVLSIIEIINAFSKNRHIPIGVSSVASLPLFNDAKINGLDSVVRANYSIFRAYPPYNVSAVDLWRRSLTYASDGSVDIICNGNAENLNTVFYSPADSISQLTGKQLINNKVRRIIFPVFESSTNVNTFIVSRTNVFVETTVPVHYVMDGIVSIGPTTFSWNTNTIKAKLSSLDPVGKLLTSCVTNALGVGTGSTNTLASLDLQNIIYPCFGTLFYGTNQYSSTKGRVAFSGGVYGNFTVDNAGKDYLVRPLAAQADFLYIVEQAIARYTLEAGRLFKQGDNVDGNISFNNGYSLEFRTSGPAPTIGVATLTAGSATVNTTAVKANSIILFTYATAGGTQGILRTGTITAGTSFVITSSSGTDTSTVNWVILQRDTTTDAP